MFSICFNNHVSGALTVSMTNASGDVLTLWRHEGDAGKQWYGIDVSLPSGTYRIQFTATYGNSIHGDIAIDDITLVPESKFKDQGNIFFLLKKPS